MAQVTELNEKLDTKTVKPGPKSAQIGRSGRFLNKFSKNKANKKSDFSKMDKILISITSVVAFGGIVFCTVMLILMTSITY